MSDRRVYGDVRILREDAADDAEQVDYVALATRAGVLGAVARDKWPYLAVLRDGWSYDPAFDASAYTYEVMVAENKGDLP